MAIGRSKVVIIGAGNVGTAPVSYTHLGLCSKCTDLIEKSCICLLRAGGSPMSFMSFVNFSPVSYTHLDVYKRQHRSLPVYNTQINPMDCSDRSLDTVPLQGHRHCPVS